MSRNSSKVLISLRAVRQLSISHASEGGLCCADFRDTRCRMGSMATKFDVPGLHSPSQAFICGHYQYYILLKLPKTLKACDY